MNEKEKKRIRMKSVGIYGERMPNVHPKEAPDSYVTIYEDKEEYHRVIKSIDERVLMGVEQGGTDYIELIHDLLSLRETMWYWNMYHKQRFPFKMLEKYRERITRVFFCDAYAYVLLERRDESNPVRAFDASQTAGGFTEFLLYKTQEKMLDMIKTEITHETIPIEYKETAEDGNTGVIKRAMEGVDPRPRREEKEAPKLKGPTIKDEILSRGYNRDEKDKRLNNSAAMLELLTHIVSMQDMLHRDYYGVLFFTSVLVGAVREGKTLGSVGSHPNQAYKCMDGNLLEYTYVSKPTDLFAVIENDLKKYVELFPNTTKPEAQNQLRTPYTDEVLAAYVVNEGIADHMSNTAISKRRVAFWKSLRGLGEMFIIE